ncbi:MAG: hypothetical protein KBC96_03175 [Armatimonadetes bacterium]|nr:hypothetical protein [Armatimonadota bacterium]
MAVDIHRFLITFCLTFALAASAAATGAKAVILKSQLPGDDAALSDLVEAQIRQAGYEIRSLSAEDICGHGWSDTDLLVLPNSAALPAKSTGAIEAFLKAGGDIIALNAPMWQTAYIMAGGKWITLDDYQRAKAGTPPPHVIYDFKSGKASDWHRASDNDREPSTIEIVDQGPAAGTRSAHVVIPNLTSWDTYGVAADIEKAFPAGHTLTVFSAKGGPLTTQLAIEWVENDGSRWIAVVPLYPEWRQYVLVPEDFKYWLSNPNRGFRGDRLKPENAVRMSFGMAHTHMGAVIGRQEYWVGPFGTAQMTAEYEEVLGAFDPPRLDILSPGYKFFDSTGAASLSVREDQTVAGETKLDVPGIIRSPHPRPGGGGFDKGRAWRYIPLVQAETAGGEWRGTPVTMIAHADGPFKGGVWASFGIGGTDWYKSPAALGLVRQIAERMLEGEFFVDAGTDFYTYFDDQQIMLGATVANLGKESPRTVKARVVITEAKSGRIATDAEFTLTHDAGQNANLARNWKPERWPEGGYIATAELLVAGKVVDRVTHPVNVWTPKRDRHFVTTEDGDFVLDGKRWRAHGVNYMPSSGVGTEDGEYFEHWIGARSYDPEIVQRDIDHMKDLGYNAVSVFMYTGHHKAQNMLDLLRRLDAAGMRADVSLRPGTPMDFLWPQIGEMITDLRLHENDTVVAYDLAWEPMFGHQRDRVIWDGEWEKWIVERYGSVENAEKDWGFPVTRDANGKITNPEPHQTLEDGEWRVMAAAYRRFLDTLLYKKYGEARQLIRSVDPNHLVSFRMAEASNPNYRWEGRIPYDFPYLAGAVDFLAPEAYGRIGDSWEKVKPAWFQFEYARWAAPEKPMLWKEQGVTAWDNSQMRSTEDKLEYQARFYEQWYQMLIKSGADGLYSWYYPGGFRVGENSDYGVINPDGSDKPVSKVIRRYADQYLNGPSSKPIDYWITIDRDKYPEGIAGIYDASKRRFWAAIDQGLAPGLRTDGTGTTSANCPLVAVGNVPLTGNNPPKYLDAAFDLVEVQDSNGRWVRAEKDGSIRVASGTTVKARIGFTNLGEATLLSGKRETGTVVISAHSDRYTLPVRPKRNVGHLQSATVETRLYENVKSPVEVTLAFDAMNRTQFGERFTITLVPAD